MVGKEEKENYCPSVAVLGNTSLVLRNQCQPKVWAEEKAPLAPAAELHHHFENRPELLPRKHARGFIHSLPNSAYEEVYLG